MKKIILYTSIFVLFCYSHASAASVFVTQEQKNGVVVVSVMLDTTGTSVNALSGTLSFDTDHLGNPSIHTEKSIINNWIDAPRLDALHPTSIQNISWSGIIPGGFDGVRSPFYEGTRPGELFEVVFTPLIMGSTTVSIKGVDLRANDGLATPIPVDNTSLDITIAQTSTSVDRITSVDSNNLHALVAHDKNIFNDRWFVAFDDAVDTSAIDHYEILETQASSLSLLINPDWHTATSPVVLSDQTRSSYVYIKAVGRDNSVAYNIIAPEIIKVTLKNILMYGILLIVLIMSILLLNILRKKIKNKK